MICYEELEYQGLFRSETNTGHDIRACSEDACHTVSNLHVHEPPKRQMLYKDTTFLTTFSLSSGVAELIIRLNGSRIMQTTEVKTVFAL